MDTNPNLTPEELALRLLCLGWSLLTCPEEKRETEER